MVDDDRAGNGGDPSANDPTREIGPADVPRAADLSLLPPGTRVGPYRIRDVLGEGGFAVVYLAEQEEPFTRTVAFKVLRAEGVSREILRRFRIESEALALMDHPGVAKILDAGIVPEGAPGGGRPWLAMEYVDGEWISRWVERHRPGVRETVRLFLQVCRAVQHAHARGILHRDLKPSNILVTGESDPVAKVIDFGVAKVFAGPLRPRVTATRGGGPLGTLEYMAPEILGGRSGAGDVRSDVWSLGVILHELLTGELPFDWNRLRELSLPEMCERVQRGVPSPPSARLTRRRGDRSLARELAGDMDRIVAWCLEPDPEERYPTVAALAEDLERWLRDEPISVPGAGLGTRWRRFRRRHRRLLAVAVAALLSLAVGLATTTWMAVRARRAEREARRQQRIAESINRFLLEDLLSPASPAGRPGEGKDVTVREVLRRASERLAGEPGTRGRFADAPEVLVGLQLAVAGLETNLGEHERALALRRAAHEIARTRLGEDDPLTFEAAADEVSSCLSLGRFDEAEAIARGCLERVRPGERPVAEAIARLEEGLAIVLLQTGRVAEAKRRLRRVVEMKEELYGAGAHGTLVSRSNLAVAELRLGETDAALREFLALVEAFREEGGGETTSSVNARNLAANCYLMKGEADKALPLLREAVEITREIAGPRHPRTIVTMANLAAIFSQLERFEEALPWIEEACRLGEGRLAPQTSWKLLAQRGILEGYTGRPEEALRSLEEAERMARSAGINARADYSELLGALVRTCEDLYRKTGARRYRRMARRWQEEWERFDGGGTLAPPDRAAPPAGD